MPVRHRFQHIHIVINVSINAPVSLYRFLCVTFCFLSTLRNTTHTNSSSENLFSIVSIPNSLSHKMSLDVRLSCLSFVLRWTFPPENLPSFLWNPLSFSHKMCSDVSPTCFVIPLVPLHCFGEGTSRSAGQQLTCPWLLLLVSYEHTARFF